MAFIKCPQCGHTALSVASTCPSCGLLLVQNRMQQGGHAGLTECRRCEKQIAGDAVVCPFCGHHTRRSTLVRSAAWSLLLVAAAAGGVVLYGTMRERSAPEPAPAAQVRAPAAAQAPLPPVEAPEPIAAPPVQPAVPAVTDSLPPARTGTRPRWTTNWVNVRESPGPLGPVVGVLRPGTAVRVGEARDGWWAIYVNGVRTGWAAGDLLSTTPPDSVP